MKTEKIIITFEGVFYTIQYVRDAIIEDSIRITNIMCNGQFIDNILDEFTPARLQKIQRMVENATSTRETPDAEWQLDEATNGRR